MQHRASWICFARFLVAPAHAEQWIVHAGKVIDVERGGVLDDRGRAVRLD